MTQSLFDAVVVGVDFSNYSKLVVRQAYLLAKEFGARVVLAHIFEKPTLVEKAVFSDVKGDFENYYRAFIERHYGLPSEDPISGIQITFGKPDEELIKIAKNQDRPLLMVGHRGKSLIKRFFLGSTAERLSLTSPVPVWIHRGDKLIIPRKILIPYDLTVHAERSVHWAHQYRNYIPAEVELFYVNAPAAPILDYKTYFEIRKKMKSIEERVIQKTRERHPELIFKEEVGDPANEISHHSEKFDLITMSPHNRPKHFPALGSVTAKVVRTGDIPVLIV